MNQCRGCLTSQFFRIISYCFLNHQHPVGSGRVKINIDSIAKLQPSLFTERISRIYYFWVVLTTGKQISRFNAVYFRFYGHQIDCRNKLKLCKTRVRRWGIFPLKFMVLRRYTRERGEGK